MRLGVIDLGSNTIRLVVYQYGKALCVAVKKLFSTSIPRNTKLLSGEVRVRDAERAVEAAV